MMKNRKTPRKKLLFWSLTALLFYALVFPLYSEDAAIVTYSEGSVEFASETEDWRPAAAGTLLEWGDRVRAGRGGKAVIILADERSVDIHEQSTLVLDKKELSSSKGIGKIIGGLFQLVKNKFSDTKYTNAALGEVGIVRGEPSKEELKDYPLSADAERELNDKKEALFASPDEEKDARNLSRQLLFGILLEEYQQYRAAEDTYEGILESEEPAGTTAAALLIDLYVKNDMLGKAQKIQDCSTGRNE